MGFKKIYNEKIMTILDDYLVVQLTFSDVFENMELEVWEAKGYNIWLTSYDE